jgi:hypothetical protein
MNWMSEGNEPISKKIARLSLGSDWLLAQASSWEADVREGRNSSCGRADAWPADCSSACDAALEIVAAS